MSGEIHLSQFPPNGYHAAVMAGMLLQTARALVVLIFLVGMPVLALPTVANRIGGWLYPKHPATPPAQAYAPKSSRPAERLRISVVAMPEPQARDVDIDRSLDRQMAELMGLGATFYRLEQVDAAIYRFTAEFYRPGPLPQRFRLITNGSEPAGAVENMLAKARRRVER